MDVKRAGLQVTGEGDGYNAKEYYNGNIAQPVVRQRVGAGAVAQCEQCNCNTYKYEPPGAEEEHGASYCGGNRQRYVCGAFHCTG